MIKFQRAVDMIEWFNRGQYAYADVVVRNAFDQQIDPQTHYARFVLLDALFFTNMNRSKPTGGLDRKTMFHISESIRTTLPRIEQILDETQITDLMTIVLDERQRKAIGSVLEMTMSACNNKALSFSTKYLHFLRPNTFALWDIYVPAQVRLALPEMKIAATPSVGAYNSLLIALREIWKSYTENEKRLLFKKDLETQPDGWKVENSAVRILDKIFWSLGKQTKKQ